MEQIDARRELEILRCSVARIAQRLGVSLDDRIKLFDDGPVGLEVIAKLCKKDRGWNALCAAIMCELDDREQAILSTLQVTKAER